MKASEQFKSAIENYINSIAQSDTVFAPHLAKASKNLESCLHYIFGEVKKTGFCAFDNQEIFNMAIKYYTDDTIAEPAPLSCKVAVNQTVKPDLFSAVPVTPQITLPKTEVIKTPKPTQTSLTLFDL